MRGLPPSHRDAAPARARWTPWLGRAALLGLLLLAACVRQPPPVWDPPPTLPLQGVVGWVGGEAPRLTPGTDLAIAVRDLATGETATLNGDVPHVSASSAKVLYVAAALKRVGLEPVAPHGDPIFRKSDNVETAAVIDLIGAEAVNDYFRELGLKHTALTTWSVGKPRKPANSPRELDGDNYFTAADVVDFLARLDSGELLPQAETDQLRAWMRLTPRKGCGGWLGTLLPPPAQEAVEHKAGWLPPGCCSSDAKYNTLTEVGLVQVPGGHRYAVAVLAEHGTDFWGLQAPFVERASCLIYRTIAHEPLLPCHFTPAASRAPADCE